MRHYRVLIIGGGNAGLSVAAKLLRKRPNLSIGIIEPSEVHYYQPAWTLVGGGTFDVDATIRNEAAYMPKGAQWIKDAASSFQPEQNQIICGNGAGYTYDFLVVAPGIQLDWDKIKGLKETLGKNGVTSKRHPIPGSASAIQQRARLYLRLPIHRLNAVVHRKKSCTSPVIISEKKDS